MKKSIFLLLTSLVLFASEKPTLTVYTYDSFASSWGPGPKVKTAFEESCNCTLNLVGVSSSISTLRKIQLEGKKTKADVSIIFLILMRYHMNLYILYILLISHKQSKYSHIMF